MNPPPPPPSSSSPSKGSAAPPPPPPIPPPQVSATTSNSPSKSSNTSHASSSDFVSTIGTTAVPTPHSKLLNHQPLDAPDELDRKWYAHFYHMQKTIQGKDEAATLALLKQQPAEGMAPLPFQPDIALIYAVITETTQAKQYLRFLLAVAVADSFKNCIGWLQKLIDLKFVKLLVACRSQLLWLVRELVHLNTPGIDKVIVCLMRYLTGGDSSRTTVWLASSIIRILIEHESWLLSCSSLIPFVFHTFARISLDHIAAQHASLLKQEVELCTTLWNHRQADVAQLGREIVRVLSDAKDIPGMNALWKQLRNVQDTAAAEKDVTVYSVAQLMVIPTPPKYLAYRLNPKMEEHLLFMMERVQAGSVTRYQKWFSSQFLSTPGSDALVPDLVRYICAVYHPSNQILSSKVTPRYHILGWLYLLCHGSKTPNVLARVQLAMFFDYLYFKPSDNVMSVEPAMLLMVKSLKSHPMVTLAMIQFLVFAVEKFAASAVNRKLMQTGVSTAFSTLLKLGVVPSILPLQSFPMLLSSAPELQSELHRIFPEHFPSAENARMAQAPISSAGDSSVESSGSTTSSPGRQSPGRHSPIRESPVHCSPIHKSPVHQSPVRSSPIGAGSPVTIPPQSPTHLDAGAVAGGASSDPSSLDAVSFLPYKKQAVSDVSTSDDALPSIAPAVSKQPVVDVPASVVALGGDLIEHFLKAVPEPCSRPTESFLECLNDIVISWTRQDNAVEIAGPLGSFLHASLERIIVSSPIGYNDSSKTVFESLMDQVLCESMDIYLPFLKALYVRDVTNSYRLLAFCCARSKGKTVESALGPYIAFINVIGGNVAQNILKDLNLSQQIDDARAQACALLDKPMADGRAEDELDAVSVTALVVCPFLFANMDHPLLSKLMSRSEALVQLLLGLVTPALLHTLCTRVVMREFAIFTNRLANIVVSSLQWTSWEQYSMWDLVIAELQSGRSATAEQSMMAAARKVLACVSPRETPETMTGLLKCLIHFCPDDSMLHNVLKLPDAYDDFSFALLTCWMHKFPDVVTTHVRSALEGARSEFLMDKTVAEVLRKLDRLQDMWTRSVVARDAETKVLLPLLQDESIISVVKRLLHRAAHMSLPSDNYPVLQALLVDGGPPRLKKQKLAQDN